MAGALEEKVEEVAWQVKRRLFRSLMEESWVKMWRRSSGGRLVSDAGCISLGVPRCVAEMAISSIDSNAKCNMYFRIEGRIWA